MKTSLHQQQQQHERKHSDMDFAKGRANLDRMYDTLTLPQQEDLMQTVEATRKSKTPIRAKKSAASSGLINERTQAMANKLKKSVIELTREDMDNQEVDYKRTHKTHGLTQTDSNRQTLEVHRNCPESPSKLSVKAHAIPTVSAKIAFQTSSPQKSSAYGSPKKQSPVKKKVVKDKENMTEEGLTTEMFRIAFSDRSYEELEKVQLQKAIGALSEKLLLFQNI